MPTQFGSDPTGSAIGPEDHLGEVAAGYRDPHASTVNENEPHDGLRDSDGSRPQDLGDVLIAGRVAPEHVAHLDRFLMEPHERSEDDRHATAGEQRPHHEGNHLPVVPTGGSTDHDGHNRQQDLGGDATHDPG